MNSFSRVLRHSIWNGFNRNMRFSSHFYGVGFFARMCSKWLSFVCSVGQISYKWDGNIANFIAKRCLRAFPVIATKKCDYVQCWLFETNYMLSRFSRVCVPQHKALICCVYHWYIAYEAWQKMSCLLPLAVWRFSGKNSKLQTYCHSLKEL